MALFWAIRKIQVENWYFGVVAIQSHEHLDENLLRQVMRILVPVNDPIDVIENPLLISGDQLGEELALTGDDSHHERAVVYLAHPSDSYVSTLEKFP